MSDDRICLALILGASRFPDLDVEESPAFAVSATGIASYFGSHAVDEIAYRLDSSLFDSELNVIDQRRAMKDIFAANADATDLIVYYVGHGGFLRQNQEYYLALRSTEEGHQDVTGLRSSSLAEAITGRFDRVYLLLDACFAGEVVRDFQPVDLPTVVARRTLFNLPDRGVALLLASSKDHAAMSPAGLARTMFCDCLLQVLEQGIPGPTRLLTLSDVGTELKSVVLRRFGDEAVMPEVHSPQQTAGDAARAPLFINPAYKPDAGRVAVGADRLEALEQRVRELEGLLSPNGASADRAADELARIAAEEDDTGPAAHAAEVLERTGKDPRSSESVVARAALALTVRPSRSRVVPDSDVTWTCTVCNTGAVPLRGIELVDDDGTLLAPPFDLDSHGITQVQFDRHYGVRGGRRRVGASGHTDDGVRVSTEASARVRVRRVEPSRATASTTVVTAPAPAAASASATTLALPRFRRALRDVKSMPNFGDAELNSLIGLVVEGERHYRVATGRLAPPVGWASRVADWDREAKSVASQDAFVMVKFQALSPDEIVATMRLVAARLADVTGVRIPMDEFS